MEQLRYLQRIVDLSLKDFDDWEGFTDIDQFQTSALRYQLYDIVYCLSDLDHCLCTGTYSSMRARPFIGVELLDVALTRLMMTELPRLPGSWHAQCDRKVFDAERS